MNKKKIGIIAVLSILNIPISIYLSAMIHTKLANIEFSQIVVDKQLLLLFFLVYVLFERNCKIIPIPERNACFFGRNPG